MIDFSLLDTITLLVVGAVIGAVYEAVYWLTRDP